MEIWLFWYYFSYASYRRRNVSVLQELADKKGVDVIDIQLLVEAGVAKKNDLVKILGNGTLTKKLEVKAHAFSKTAIAAIEEAKGSAVKL